MRSLARTQILSLALCVLFITSCSKPAAEDPFAYPFVKPLHLKRVEGKPYSGYRAFYLLTEDSSPSSSPHRMLKASGPC